MGCAQALLLSGVLAALLGYWVSRPQPLYGANQEFMEQRRVLTDREDAACRARRANGSLEVCYGR